MSFLEMSYYLSLGVPHASPQVCQSIFIHTQIHGNDLFTAIYMRTNHEQVPIRLLGSTPINKYMFIYPEFNECKTC